MHEPVRQPLSQGTIERHVYQSVATIWSISSDPELAILHGLPLDVDAVL